MQSPESQLIITRFYAALAALKNFRIIHGKQTFTTRYGINRWNLNTVEKNPASDMFQMAWLVYLVTDFGVSADWLLTGHGEMFKKKKDVYKKIQPVPSGQSEGSAGRSASSPGEMERADSFVCSGVSC